MYLSYYAHFFYNLFLHVLADKTQMIEKLSDELESNKKEINESRIRERDFTQREGQVKLLKTKFQVI